MTPEQERAYKANLLFDTLVEYIEGIADGWDIRNAANALMRAHGGVLPFGGDGMYRRLDTKLKLAGEGYEPEPDGEEAACARAMCEWLVEYYALEGDDDGSERGNIIGRVGGADWTGELGGVEAPEVGGDGGAGLAPGAGEPEGDPEDGAVAGDSRDGGTEPVDSGLAEGP